MFNSGNPTKKTSKVTTKSIDPRPLLSDHEMEEPKTPILTTEKTDFDNSTNENVKSIDSNENINLVDENNNNKINNLNIDSSIESQQTFTIDEAISHIGSGPFQYKLLFLTGMIWAADAMEMMLLSFLIPQLEDDWSLKNPQDGLVGAIVFVGMFCGTTFWSLLSDRIGRRRVVIFSNLGAAIFGTLSAVAPDIYSMLTFRFFVGFSVAYTLFAEYSPKHNRGFMLIIEQSFWGIGAVFAVLVAWFTLTLLNWRWFLIFCSIPLWIIALFYKWVPESTRYLLTSNRNTEALDLLKRVSNDNGVELPPGTLKLDPSLALEARGKISDIFVPVYRYTSILLFTSFWVCVFGYYGIAFLSERFFEKDGGNTKGAKYWEMLVTTLSEMPALIIGAFILDKIGRKNTMIGCFATFTVCTFLLIMTPITNNKGAGVSLVFVGRMTISLSFATIYIYFSEYYPTAIRTTSLGTASSLGRIAGVITSFVSEDLSVNNAMIIYSIGGLIATVCCILLPIDTTGRDLEDKVDRSHSALPTKRSGHIALKDIDDIEDINDNDELLENEKLMNINNNNLTNIQQL